MEWVTIECVLIGPCKSIVGLMGDISIEFMAWESCEEDKREEEDGEKNDIGLWGREDGWEDKGEWEQESKGRKKGKRRKLVSWRGGRRRRGSMKRKRQLIEHNRQEI